MNSPEIQRFLVSVRLHLARGRRRAVIARVACGAGMLAVIWALAWRVTGYAAPLAGYGVIAMLGMVAAGLWIWLGRRDLRQAALVADRTFSLKDSLVSWLDFNQARRDGEIYQLSERHIERRIAALDAKRIPISPNRMVSVIGLVLGVTALCLALLPHSEVVRKRLAQEAMTAERSAEIQRQMDDAIEEIVRNMTVDERQWFQPEVLRSWAKRLQTTMDARENEMQLARIEQEISKAMLGLEARQDEAVLKLAAEELRKAPQVEARQLGERLELKQFKQAAEQVRKMKPAIPRDKSPQDRADALAKAARARDVAKRMADGARKREFSKVQGSASRDQDSGEGGPEEMQGMKETLEKFEEQAERLASSLERNEGRDDREKSHAMELGKSMDGLGERLGKLDARQKAREKLDALRLGLADARRFAQGKTESLGLAASVRESTGQGSEDPGSGKDPARRNERDELAASDRDVALRGKPNPDGPSRHSVESAASGAGVAGRSHLERQRQFQRQLESLVRRDDIPESLKRGVREYFERVHDIPPDGSF